MLIVVPYHSTFVAEVFVPTWVESSVGRVGRWNQQPVTTAPGKMRLKPFCKAGSKSHMTEIELGVLSDL